jgi:hypothetical protein
VCADARIARFVGETILVVPPAVRSTAREFLIALAVGARRAERSFEAGLSGRVRLLDLIHGDIGFEMDGARISRHRIIMMAARSG